MTHARRATFILLAAALAAAPMARAQTPPRAAAPRSVGAQMVTEANLSRDGLKAMYEAAKLPATVDAGGNLTVTLAQVLIHALPGKDHVRLLASFRFAPRAAMQERLDLANRINDGYIMVRAAVPLDRPGELAVDHYIVLGPGVSRAAIVAATQRFAEVVAEAVGALDDDGLLN